MNSNTYGGWKSYHTLWLWLMLGWTVSAADRAVTGPVVTWMIQNKVSFLMDAVHPHALGGLVGSIFFTGYMLTQFPGGYYGDKFGQRKIIVISLMWAAIATIVSGFMVTLIGFIALRVITGLGEGIYYANDRVLITEATPFEKRSLGLGVVITGLAIGGTLAVLLPPFLIDWGNSVFGAGQGWKMPFLILGAATFIVAVGIFIYFKKNHPENRATHHVSNRSIVAGLGKYNIIFFAAIMAVFFIADRVGLQTWVVAIIELIFALLLVGFTYLQKGKELSAILRDKNLVILYIAGIAILWNLWFFNFWSVSIIADSAKTTFLQAALTAMFNGVAGILGFPAGGWLADYAMRRNWGRKVFLVWFTLLQGLSTLIFGFYIMSGGKSTILMGTLLFIASLFFNALQPIFHALVADTAQPKLRGAAFGMLNLVGEIGAVLSPAISGTFRDMTHSWTSSILLDAAIILLSFLMLLFVREKRLSEIRSSSQNVSTDTQSSTL